MKKTALSAIVVLLTGYLVFQFYTDRQFAKMASGEEYNEWFLETVWEHRMKSIQDEIDRENEKSIQEAEERFAEYKETSTLSPWQHPAEDKLSQALDPYRTLDLTNQSRPSQQTAPTYSQAQPAPEPAPQQLVQPRVTGPLAHYETVTQLCIDKYMDALDPYREKYKDARFYPQDWESDGYAARMTGRVDVFGPMVTDSASLLCELATDYSDPSYEEVQSQFSYL